MKTPFLQQYQVTTPDEIRQAYDKIFTERPVTGADPQYRWILTLLKPAAGRRLADIACGAGFLLQEAARCRLETYGIDLSPEAVKLVRLHAPDAQVFVGDGEHLPWDADFFDYVTCLGSLEHYLHPDQGLREIRRVLKPDGVACIMLPNQYSWHIIRHVLATGEPPSEQAGFERLATAKEWQRLIEGSGLTVTRVVKQNEHKPLIDWEQRKLKSLSKYLESWLVRTLCPFRLAYHFVFLCRK